MNCAWKTAGCSGTAAIGPDRLAKLIAGSLATTGKDQRPISLLNLILSRFKIYRSVRGDIAQGLQLGVKGTPTFYMNGIHLPNLQARFFEAAVLWELRNKGAAK